MAYKLSERHEQDKLSLQRNDPNKFDLNKAALLCVIVGAISLITAYSYTFETERYVKESFATAKKMVEMPVSKAAATKASEAQKLLDEAVKNQVGAVKVPIVKAPVVTKKMSRYPLGERVFGPIKIKNANEVMSIKLKTTLPMQSWAAVDGELLDVNKNYLFGFSKELWHESGRDSDGSWTENNNDMSFSITVPEAGTYYVKLMAESQKTLKALHVTIGRQSGSYIPHMVYGGFLILFAGFLVGFKAGAYPEKKQGSVSDGIKTGLICMVFTPHIVALSPIIIAVVVYNHFKKKKRSHHFSGRKIR